MDCNGPSLRKQGPEGPPGKIEKARAGPALHGPIERYFGPRVFARPAGYRCAKAA